MDPRNDTCPDSAQDANRSDEPARVPPPCDSRAVNWDDLRFLLAVGRLGTLTKAAKKLGVNHTTVSRRLAGLEEETSLRLFERLPDGFVPTAAGEDVFRVAERMEQEVLSLDRRVIGQDARLSGPLRVTTLDSIAEKMPELFMAFTDRYPNVTLELLVGNDPLNLSRREADVAIRLSNHPPEHLIGKKVARMEFALYGAESLVERVGEDAPLTAFPFLSWELRLNARLTEAWLRDNVPDAPVVCRVDTGATMFAATRAGMGLSFLACIHGDAEPGLRRMLPVQEGFGMDLWILSHSDLRSTARVRAFIDVVGDGLIALRSRFDGSAGSGGSAG